MALEGLDGPKNWSPFDGSLLSGAGSGGQDDDGGDPLPTGVQAVTDADQSAFGLLTEPVVAPRPQKLPDFLTLDEISLFDSPLAAKGGSKGKPTDGGTSGGSGTGNGWGSGGSKDTTTTGTDTGGGGDALADYVSGGDAATSYNVEIVFSGTWTAALQQAFIDAADYLSSIILGDLSDELASTGGTIDDIRISASLASIDGRGGILGQAGPTYARVDSWLPTEAIMKFDSADAQTYLDAGTWYDIVLHEMVHSIGFGTVWNLQGLTTGSIAGGDLRFTGANAIQAYQTEFAAIANNDPGAAIGVPIETDGGSGTAGGHWDEALFGSEIMTGYLNTSNSISNMTIAALEDMGYDTVYDSLVFA